MSLLSMLKGKGPSGFGYGSTAEDVTAGLDLSGKTYLVTGCNSGLGLETMRVLSLRGATIVGAARSVDKAKNAGAELTNEVLPVACELSEPASVRACVDTVGAMGRTLDGIICNAGIMALPKLTVKHGLELQFLTNHIGHFMLVTGLLDAVADDGRLVIVSSGAHTAAPKVGIDFDNLAGQQSYAGWTAYGRSKLANILFTRELARRLTDAGSKKTANTLHPGVIATNLGRHMNAAARVALGIAKPLFLKTTGQGAATQTYVATHPDVAGVTGEYFADCNVSKTTAVGRDMDLAAKLWATTEELVAGFE